jgi:threonine synthase
MEAVTDDEIVDAIELLARTEGMFAETAGGVTIGALAKLAASGVVRPDERVVAFVTGIGLKTLEAVAPRARPTASIAPTLDAFAAAVDLEAH